MTKLIWQEFGDVIGTDPIAFSPDSKTFIACSIDPDLRSFKFWDISETPNFSRFQFINTTSSFGGYDFWFYPCLAISPDSQKLAIYTGFDVELWNLSSGQFLDHFFLADEIDRHYDLEKPLLRISFISDKKLIFELILGDSYLFYTWKYRYAYNRRCLNYLGIARFPESCPILSCCHDRNLFLVMNHNLQIISLTETKREHLNLALSNYA